MKGDFSVVIRHEDDKFAHRLMAHTPQRRICRELATELNAFFAEQGLKFVARVEEEEEKE